MTDTLKRLGGPTTPGKAGSGTTLYTPGASVTAAVKHAIVANARPWDAYITLGLNDLTTRANILVPSLFVPAWESVMVPLDAIVTNAASDTVRAFQRIPYQNIYGDASLLQTPAVVTNGTGNAGAAASVATGSWTEVNGTLYLLTVAWRKAGGAGTISSFTDTHTGISWTLIDSITSADGNSKLATYAAVSGGTTATTTTVNFSASQDASAVIVTNVALTGTFDATTANGVDGVVTAGTDEDPRSVTTPKLQYAWRPTRSNRIMSLAASGTATTHTAATGWTELNDVATNHSLYTAHMIGSISTGNPNVYAPTLAAANGLTLAIGVEVQEPHRPLSVSLYGVEVT